MSRKFMAELIILNRNLSDSKPDSLFFILLIIFIGFPGGSVVKNPPAMQKLQVGSPSWEDPLEEEMATHSSIIARIIPWTDREAWQVTVHGVTKGWT